MTRRPKAGGGGGSRSGGPGGSSAGDSPSKEPLMSPARGVCRKKNGSAAGGVLKAECTEGSPAAPRRPAYSNASFRSTGSPVWGAHDRLLGGDAAGVEEEEAGSPPTPRAIHVTIEHPLTEARDDEGEEHCRLVLLPALTTTHPLTPGSSSVSQTSPPGGDPRPSHPDSQTPRGPQPTANGVITSSRAPTSLAKVGTMGATTDPAAPAKPKLSLKDKTLLLHSRSIKATQSDTVLISNGSTAAPIIQKPPKRQAHSTSSLTPLRLATNAKFREFIFRTGIVRRAKTADGKELSADMVDFSELYAQPNTVLSLGVVGLVVGCVSIIMSFTSPGMRMWRTVGYVALAVGAVLCGLGGCWYYARSQIVFTAVSAPDIEIKVVSGSEDAAAMRNGGVQQANGGKKTSGV